MDKYGILLTNNTQHGTTRTYLDKSGQKEILRKSSKIINGEMPIDKHGKTWTSMNTNGKTWTYMQN